MIEQRTQEWMDELTAAQRAAGAPLYGCKGYDAELDTVSIEGCARDRGPWYECHGDIYCEPCAHELNKLASIYCLPNRSGER